MYNSIHLRSCTDCWHNFQALPRPVEIIEGGGLGIA